jgi:hypothetical protein
MRAVSLRSPRSALLHGPAFGAGLRFFAGGSDEHDRTVRLPAPVAGDPRNPVRAARFAVDLNRAWRHFAQI